MSNLAQRPQLNIPDVIGSPILAEIEHINDLGKSKWYEVVYYDDATRLVTLSEPVPIDDLDANYYIAFRKRTGGATDSYSVTLTEDAYQVILNEVPSIVPDFGIDRERTHYAFGLADSLYVNAKVLGIKPRSLERVEIACVVDSDFVYSADTGAVPTESAWQLATRITVPVLRGLIARSDPADVTKMYLSWQPAAGADRYLIEVSDNGNGWTRIGETSVSNYTAIASYGARTVVRIAPIGTTRGAWVSVQYGSSADYMWDIDDTILMWNVVTTTPMWGG